jgi:uncharacterized protein GlcG (DUF336 family)
MANVTLAEAVEICDAATAKAREMGIKVAVSVVDSATNLVAFHKMDGTLVLAIEASKGKAVASVMFGQPSGELVSRAESPVLRAVQMQMNGRFIMGQGALPISRDGEVVGACGVSGGTSKDDEDCARAGIGAP